MKQTTPGLAAAILSLCLVLGCTKPASSQSSGPAVQPAPQAGARPETSLPSPNPRAQPLSLRPPAPDAAAGRAVQASAQPTPPPPTPATSADLLAVDLTPPIAARDFRIGPLYVPGAEKAAPREAEELVARLLDGLVLGKVETALFDLQSQDRLTRSLQYYTTNGALPLRYRIGELHERGEGEVIANVRLFGATGVAEGEVYLLRSAEGWRVDDLQVGFPQLAVAYVPPSEPFVPSSYEFERPAGNGE